MWRWILTSRKNFHSIEGIATSLHSKSCKQLLTQMEFTLIHGCLDCKINWHSFCWNIFFRLKYLTKKLCILTTVFHFNSKVFLWPSIIEFKFFSGDLWSNIVVVDTQQLSVYLRIWVNGFKNSFYWLPV